MATGSYLIDKIRDSFKTCKDPRMYAEEEFSVGYPTGFLSFDFTNGTVIHVRTEDRSFDYYSIGITDGSFVILIGRSGSGKSTLMTQMAANIIRPFQNACMFVDDLEGGVQKVRREQLTEFYGQDYTRRVVVRNTGITIENFYERIRMIFDIKNKNRGELSYDTGLYDNVGQRVIKLIPTLYCLDSIALIMSDKYVEEEELSGQMATTATAKNNSAVFRRIIPMLKSANIILMSINHITESVDISMFAKKKSQVAYLKQNERLPGGNAIIYLANNIIRVDDVSKLKESEGLGIAGSTVELTLVKSRTNRAGQSCRLVFDYDNGFDNDLSLLMLLKEEKKISGAGAYFYIEGHPEHKFSQKTFKQKLSESEEFRSIFITSVFEILKARLDIQESQYATTHGYDVNREVISRLMSNQAAS